MKKSLPQEFITLRQPLFGDEWTAFADSYNMPKAYGLRRNPLKDCGVLPFALEQVPWTPEGFYANPEDCPGKHPLHEAGAYYIQEPSAMSVVSLLEPKPGDTVCDLCAAPGGKSTQIAGMLQGDGFLVSNEIFPARAKILSQNIERLGISNALVCNEPPDRMASFFPFFFDRIVVDAPCSGEGMFRKDDTAIGEWSPENVAVCVKRQRMILECADTMLKPGGVLVYSTCTFSPEEDEEMVAWFLASHSDYVLEDWRDTSLGDRVSQYPDNAGLCGGRPDWADYEKLQQEGQNAGFDLPDNLSEELRKTLRLWPHKLKGEGHFAARLRKRGTSLSASSVSSSIRLPQKTSSPKKKKNGKTGAGAMLLSEAVKGLEQFQKEYLQENLLTPPGKAVSDKERNFPPRLELFGEQLYLLPLQAPSLAGIKVVRAGLQLGSCRKNRFEPSYALAKTLSKKQVRQYHDCSYEEAVRYLKGETLSCDNTHKGWTLVCYENFPLGWGKAQNGMLKNHFPKGLRWV